MKRFYILFITLFCVIKSTAQITVFGKVEDTAQKSLQGCTVLLFQADSIVGGTITDQKGNYKIKNLLSGNYICKISMVGFIPAEYRFKANLGAVRIPTITLKEDDILLKEVEVVGDLAKFSAGMSTYTLTQRARLSKNAYEALMEIPELIVNPVNRTISVANGGKPLILIDGVKRENYINVLNPEIIESVEIIHNPSARYMNDESVGCILNIKLKRVKTPVYLRGDITATSNTRLDNLDINANTEIGNALSSLYFTGGYTEQTQEMDIVTNSLSGKLQRNLKGSNIYDNTSFNVTLGGDKSFSDKNYVAFNVDYTTNPSKTQQEYTGNTSYSSSDEEYEITSYSNTDNSYHNFSSNLYWKYSFSSDSRLELTGNYNYSDNNSYGSRTEKSELYTFDNRIDLTYLQNTGKLNIDYTNVFKNKMAFAAGARTTYTATDVKDKIDQKQTFPYKKWQEYLYLGLDNNRSDSKFNYVLSLGLDYVSSNADGIKNNYTDILPAISMAYKFNKNNNLSISYRRNRTSPGIDMLNPNNTSTDSLNINCGNPYLRPYTRDMLNLNYILKYKRFEIQPYFSYLYVNDMFMSVGKADGNIYYNTYENVSKKQVLLIGGIIQYKLSTGAILLQTYYRKDDIDNMVYDGECWGALLNFFKFYKKTSIGMTLYTTRRLILRIHQRKNRLLRQMSISLGIYPMH